MVLRDDRLRRPRQPHCSLSLSALAQQPTSTMTRREGLRDYAQIPSSHKFSSLTQPRGPHAAKRSSPSLTRLRAAALDFIKLLVDLRERLSAWRKGMDACARVRPAQTVHIDFAVVSAVQCARATG